MAAKILLKHALLHAQLVFIGNTDPYRSHHPSQHYVYTLVETIDFDFLTHCALFFLVCKLRFIGCASRLQAVQ